MSETRKKRVLLGVTGGIAVYKACEVLRGLQKADVDVRVMMTEDATRFVGEVTFEALSGHPVATSLYGFPESSIPHIMLSDWADLIVVVPTTGNVMAKMAAGIADDLLTATLLAANTDVLVVPAMNVRMWTNAATQANLRTLKERGIHFVMPASGYLACGDVGEGKLAEVDFIVSETLAALEGVASSTPAARDLEGKRILVTAGPTREAIDPVRFIANHSTGKMGYAIAARALERGAEVTLVSGPVSISAPAEVRLVDVTSASEMCEATLSAFEEGVDCAICTAAVADYTPKAPAAHKLKKDQERLDVIELVETTDILATLSQKKDTGQVVVGFAAETNDLIPNAHAKLERKGCDFIVANDVSRTDSTFGSDTSRISLVTPEGVEEHETMPLVDVADVILDKVASLL